MTRATRTVNPLHFEDLEPHRFEDLIRQLAYDFKSWSSIEAIGRLGSDEGIDIRATLSLASLRAEQLENDEEADSEGALETQTWIIQCKRERSIGPTKLASIAENDLSQQDKSPYGYVVAAACDFSKKARDVFREVVVRYGIEEFYLWGKAEIEDMLFRPQNDHLLFAYFGISLQARRRSNKTLARSQLALKREVVKKLGGLKAFEGEPVLIRDINDRSWYRDAVRSSTAVPRHYWQLYMHHPLGPVFTKRKCFALFDLEKREWDAIPDFDVSVELQSLNSAHFEAQQEWLEAYNIRWTYWKQHVPQVKKAWFYETALIPFDRILAVDEVGDIWHAPPQLIIELGPDGKVFNSHTENRIRFEDKWRNEDEFPDERFKINFFPNPFSE